MCRPIVLTTTAILIGSALMSLAPVANAQSANEPDKATMIERIMQADANGDGQVSRAEMIAWRAQQFSRLDRNSDGFIDMKDVPGLMASRFEPQIKQLNSQFDANHDGRVSREEFVNGPTPVFDLVDANHDGVVTKDEVRIASAKVKSLRSRSV